MEIIKKIKNGDVFYIPMENGKFGIGQVLKVNEVKRPTEGMIALLNIILDFEEIDNFKAEKFSQTEIIELSNLSLVMLKNKRWVIVDNLPLITTKIPLWAGKDIGAADKYKDGFLSDFSNKFIRYLPYEEISHMRSWFVRGPIFFENILKRKFIDPNFLPANVDENYFIAEWPDGTITEDDMAIHEYEHYVNSREF